MSMDAQAVRTALGMMTLEHGTKGVLFPESELPALFDRAAQEYMDIVAHLGITVTLEQLNELKQPVLDDVRRYLERKGWIS